jgi:hypothetical protein
MKDVGHSQISPALSLENSPCKHFIGDLVGPRVSMHGCEDKNLLHLPKFYSRTIQHLTNRNTDYAISINEWTRI